MLPFDFARHGKCWLPTLNGTHHALLRGLSHRVTIGKKNAPDKPARRVTLDVKNVLLGFQRSEYDAVYPQAALAVRSDVCLVVRVAMNQLTQRNVSHHLTARC